MDKYQKELQNLRPQDEIQDTEIFKGHTFIITAGHGYLVVPKESERYKVAQDIVKYGYKGKEAIYLEEDCEAPDFIKHIS